MTDSELFNYAIKHYNNPSCKTAEEFTNDFNLTLRIKKLINRKLMGEDINYQLLLNNFMMFYNVFDPKAGTVILFHKLPENHYSYIKTVATFLNFLPMDINMDITSIDLDWDFVEFLRGI